LVRGGGRGGIVLDFPCGGEGICGKCRVIVAQNAGEPTAAERDWLSAEELQVGWRLACQTKVCGPTEVEIPPSSRTAGAPKIFVESNVAKPLPTVDPTIEKTLR